MAKRLLLELMYGMPRIFFTMCAMPNRNNAIKGIESILSENLTYIRSDHEGRNWEIINYDKAGSLSEPRMKVGNDPRYASYYLFLPKEKIIRIDKVYNGFEPPQSIAEKVNRHCIELSAEEIFDILEYRFKYRFDPPRNMRTISQTISHRNPEPSLA